MNLSGLTSFIPVTVLSALILFIVKEVLEFTRRKNADIRKRTAVRTLLINECERNYWTLKSIILIIKDINENTYYQDVKFDISKDKLGNYSFRVSLDGEKWSSSRVPSVHKSILEKYIMEIALVDKKVFYKCMDVFDALANLENIRSHILNIGEHDQKSHFDALVSWSTKELDKIHFTLNELYRECSGKEMKDHRV